MDTATGEMSTEELRQDIASQRDDIGRDLEAIGDRLSPGRMAGRTRERTRRRMSTWRDRLMGSVEQAKGSVSQMKDRMGESGSGSDTSGAVSERVEGSPLAAGMVAFGIGFIAGSLLPTSGRERELARSMEPQVKQVAQEAAGTAREAGESLAPKMKEEAEAVKEEATGAASEVAGTAKAEMSSARDEVKSKS